MEVRAASGALHKTGKGRRSRKNLPPARHPWEILDLETPANYAMFKIFRDTNPIDRNLRSLAKVFSVSPSTIHGVAGDFNWAARAAAWDYHIECARLELSEQYQLDMFKRHADVCVSLIEKVKLRLAKMRPDTLKPRDVAQWIDIATKIERLSRGVANESVAQSLTQINVQVENMSRLSDQELEKIIADEKKRKLRIGAIDMKELKN